MLDRQKKRHAAFREGPRFPRRHLAIAASTLIALGISLLMLPGENAEAKRTAIPLNLELTPISPSEQEPEPLSPIEPQREWLEIEVRPGDSLSSIFNRAKLSPQDLHELISTAKKTKALNRIRPGQKLGFQISDQGKLDAMSLQVDKLNSLIYERGVTGFSTTEVSETPEVRQRVASATITSSLYKAAQEAGVSQSIIMELANIFGGVLDFVYDVRKNDYFIVIYEELYLNGEHLGSGQILAAQYFNRGDSFQAYRYVNKQGEIDYFSESGESMRKAFLRAPLDFTRISSRFDPKRLHPVFKTVRPHRGVDYAAPRGTPVYAAGDGRVLEAGYSRANGNYVFIKHGEAYVTKYLHLHKRAVSRGERVRQRETIGWVGSTGYATGPHLHYEFLMNGVHRNPATIVDKLPPPTRVGRNDMPDFLQQISGLQLQLRTYAAQRNYNSPGSEG
ncbi:MULTISPECIES: OapA family protein [Spongiibacter]|jgi:murein DD-endopeptidase MepM/ murein hydrolase activator NlpD|uniref:OapA family protein n=1 Tax=Spongiibacter TaxID=630749 RepID=UPI001960E7B0|nr:MULTISPECIES: peptidoglycan DD-metalloendopeptidase family protein [Spongiibacter]MBM7424898.1 murein DD-endopeptidase MepM/ murein hydrolase activator NlpD [Spongiibacter marinus]|tara:strand:+ start:1611 stop:2954 length:1344 start_codon:yes stop_codon:yes gene_type:complete